MSQAKGKQWIRFGRKHRALPYVVYGPMISFFLFESLVRYRLPWTTALELLVCGMALWTLMEYFIHRFLFHSRNSARIVTQESHRLHHEAPFSREFLVAPVFVSLPVTLLSVAVFYLLTFNPAFTFALVAGVEFAYLLYEVAHYTAHHRQPKTRLMKDLKRYHLLHHFEGGRTRFGVTSPFWDKVFGTSPQRKDCQV